MSATGLDVFDTTLQKTNRWLNEATGVLERKDKHTAYVAFRSTLHALRDRMTVEEVAQLAAQLPMLLRGFYCEGWDPSGKPLKLRTREEFFARIAQELEGADDGLDPEMLARASERPTAASRSTQPPAEARPGKAARPRPAGASRRPSAASIRQKIFRTPAHAFPIRIVV